MSADGQPPAAQVKKSPAEVKSMLESDSEITYLDVRFHENRLRPLSAQHAVFKL
jgi:hypothetical protein